MVKFRWLLDVRGDNVSHQLVVLLDNFWNYMGVVSFGSV